jgi:hypothetical protein
MDSAVPLAYLHEEIDLATIIKTLQLRWLGHVCRMGEQISKRL